MWPEAPQQALEAAHADAAGDSERKAARRLREHPAIVALAARRVWQRSLTEERENSHRNVGVGNSPSQGFDWPSDPQIDDKARAAEQSARGEAYNRCRQPPWRRTLIPLGPLKLVGPRGSVDVGFRG